MKIERRREREQRVDAVLHGGNTLWVRRIQVEPRDGNLIGSFVRGQPAQVVANLQDWVEPQNLYGDNLVKVAATLQYSVGPRNGSPTWNM